MRIIYTALALTIIFCAGVYAQDDVQVSAELSSPEIGINEQVTLSVTVSGNRSVQEPQLPPLEGFNIFSTGQQYSSQIVNGRMSTQVKFNYIMMPTQTGKFVVRPIQVKVGGKTYTTEPLTLTVTASRTPQGPSGGASGASRRSATDDDEFIIEAQISKDTVYEGEMLLYRFFAFQKRGVGFLSDPSYIPPSYSGFWKEDFGWKRFSRVIRGNAYVANEMDIYLFPVTPGQITIEPTRVVVTPDRLDNLLNFDPFNPRSLRSRGLRTEPETLYTEPKVINVLPLPAEGRPRSFKGSVGDFNMKVDISGTEVTVDETILMTMQISGKGNIKTITPPDLPEIEGLDIRPSGDSIWQRETGGEIIGAKIFEFSIIPEQEGVYEIPSLKWSYFDPSQEQYKTHSTDSYTIDISPGRAGPSDAISGLMTPKSDLKLRGILAVKPLEGGLKKSSTPLILKPGFIAMQGLPILILAGVIVLRRRQEKLMGDIRYRRLKRARGMARKHLSEANGLLKSGRMDDFYGAVSRAVFQYVGDKFNRSASGLTESEVASILEEHHFSDEIRSEFKELIDELNFGRYAPGGGGEEHAREILRRAEKWIVAAENEGRRIR